jgi:hypothetical protein
MFKLTIEIEVPTEEHEEARIVHDHMKAYIERGLGFYCQTAFHRWFSTGIRRSPNVDPGSHRHSHIMTGRILKDQNGNWIFPAQSGETISEAEVRERWELEQAISHVHQYWKEEEPPEPEFLEEKDMKL